MHESTDTGSEYIESLTPDANGSEVTETQSRRTLMTGAVAAGAGVVAGMLISGNPAGAANGDAVTVGGFFSGDTTTLTPANSSVVGNCLAFP